MAIDRALMAEALPRYEIGEELGRGAWGVVYSAHHEALGRDVAIKALPLAVADDPEVRRRFRAEAKTVASLHHPHIVAIHDFVEHGSLCLLVMEKLSGGTLATRFAELGLSYPASCSAVLAAGVALSHAHRLGILHRDIKPQNLLFGADDTLKVTDFGIAKVIGGSQTMATSTGQVLGTPTYMAPEQVLGEDLTPATDVYSLGTILYSLLSGELPYARRDNAMAVLHAHAYEDPIPLVDVAPSVPAPVAACVMSAIARDRLVRYASAEEFGCDLAEAANEVWGTGWVNASGFEVVASGRIGRSLTLPPGARLTPTDAGAGVTVHPSAPMAPDAPTPSSDPGQLRPVGDLLRSPDPSPTVSLRDVPPGREVLDSLPSDPPTPTARPRPGLGLLLTALGGVALLAATCLAWFHDPDNASETWSGWTFPQGRVAAGLALTAVVLGVVGWRARDGRVRTGLAVGQVVVSGLALALLVQRSLSTFEPENDTVLHPGMWVAVAAGVVLLAGSVLILVAAGRSRGVDPAGSAPSGPAASPSTGRPGVGLVVTAIGAVALVGAMGLPWFDDPDSGEPDTWSGWTFPQGRMAVSLAVVAVVLGVVGWRVRSGRARRSLAVGQVVASGLALALLVQRSRSAFEPESDTVLHPGMWVAVAAGVVLLAGSVLILVAARRFRGVDPAGSAPAVPGASPDTGRPGVGLVVTAVGAVALLGSTCLAWFHDPDNASDTWSGWTFPQGRAAVVVALLALALGVIGWRVREARVRALLAVGQLVLSGLALALLVQRSRSAFEPEGDTVLHVGMWVAVAAGVVLLAGAVITMVRSRRSGPVVVI